MMVTWLQFPSNINVTYIGKSHGETNEITTIIKLDSYFDPTGVVNHFEPNRFFGNKLKFLVGRQLIFRVS